MGGPRSGIILLGEHSAPEFARKIDGAVFPGVQGLYFVSFDHQQVKSLS